MGGTLRGSGTNQAWERPQQAEPSTVLLRWATRRRPLKPGQRLWGAERSLEWLWEQFSWSQESPKQAGP